MDDARAIPPPDALATDALELARRCCSAVGLDPLRDAEQVLEGVDLASEDWPPCCDSGCDPCINTLISAARLLRSKLAVRGS